MYVCLCSRSLGRSTFTAVWTLITLLHLHGRTFFVCINFDRENAHDVFVQTHQTFHLLHGSCRCVRADKGIVALAVFVNLVSHRFDAPVLGHDDLAVVVSENCREMFDEAFCLRVGQVLTRNHHMLV
ncbi:hypothetical protein GQR58_018322 [Nymphon striatum]|nr:hypothetical protein GQR58_018322 [Nymphon striatum]